MPEKNIKHVIFDFDGTIVDTMGLAIRLINEAAEKYKYRPVREEDLDYLRSLSLLDRLKAVNVSPYQIPRIGMELSRTYSKALASIEVFAGMREVIGELKQRGFALSIISSNSHYNIRKFLADNQLHLFDHIYCAKNLFGKDKTIASMIKKLHLQRDELIYIGDECRDILACKANCIKVIAVTWGFDAPQMLIEAQPDYIVSTPREIVPIVSGG